MCTKTISLEYARLRIQIQVYQTPKLDLFPKYTMLHFKINMSRMDKEKWKHFNPMHLGDRILKFNIPSLL